MEINNWIHPDVKHTENKDETVGHTSNNEVAVTL